jgi:shikimate dehydrogenase
MKHKKTAVIGDPIDHSLSPKIHNHWIEREGVDSDTYQKINVKKENFDEDVGRLIEEGYSGLNVTVPLKEDAYKYCHKTSVVAGTLKAVNTLIVNEDGVYGENTDPAGFQKSIVNRNLGSKQCLVLGAGGSARAVVFALKQMRCEIGIFNRTREKVELLCDDLGVEATILTESSLNEFVGSSSLVVNTTSLGQQKNEANNLINFNNLKPSTHVYDLIYNPSKTTFLQRAEKNGCTVQNGLEMLINQAAQSFNLWHNKIPAIDKDLMLALGVK